MELSWFQLVSTFDGIMTLASICLSFFFPPVGFKGNLSLLYFFPRGLKQPAL